MEQLATSFSIGLSGKLFKDVTNYNKNFCLGTTSYAGDHFQPTFKKILSPKYNMLC